MASFDRSKKKLMLGQRFALHFLLCFAAGFLTGFAPTSKSSPSSPPSQPKMGPLPKVNLQNSSFQTGILRDFQNENQSQVTNITKEYSDYEDFDMEPRKLVIVITATLNGDPLRTVLLLRLASTLKLVPPPLLWIVVEPELEGPGASELLRKTGIMYRHLVLKENIHDPVISTEYQRNLALKHIEHHRLDGIVHFARIDNVYDLSFFDEIQSTKAFATWPIAKLSPSRKKQIIEGPVCYSSQVIGWHLKKPNNETEEIPIHISSFAFSSSILWDLERWSRLSSSLDDKQNLLKFVMKAIHEDDMELMAVSREACSKVNLWQLHLSIKTMPFYHLARHPVYEGKDNNNTSSVT